MARQALSCFVPNKSVLVVAVVAVFCFCVNDVVAQVKLAKGTRPLNNHDPIQYRDCGELYKTGYNVSGVHVLYLNKTTPFLVRCEFTKDQAYTVIQRRWDNGVNFMQTLHVYKAGFGVVQTNYWAGLNAISRLTSIGNNVLTINMQDGKGLNRNARYSYFKVQSSEYKYRMTVAGFSGPGLHDDFSVNNGMTFQTYDVPDVFKCAQFMKAGWWHNYCTNTLLNGYYYPPGQYVPQGLYSDGIFWESFDGFDGSLKFVSMSVSSH